MTDAVPSDVTDAAAEPLKPLPPFIAADPASLKLVEMAAKIAPTSTTVLILGESGTGKDQLAQRLHFLSPRRHQPLVKIDCSSLPSELIESELFGYEKGAFTGAYQAKPGRLELAGQGTLILDEIAALSLPLQAKLLRVIEDKTFERLGGHAAIQIEARLLALTNIDLERAVAQRAFREDLYYRLFVLPIVVPPLRERPADILPLAEHFLRTAARAPAGITLAPELRQALQAYAYPGNVRELRNLVNRALIWGGGEAVGGAPAAELTLTSFPAYLAAAAADADLRLEAVERAHIAAVLQRFRGRKQDAAAALGISPKTLLEKRRRYHLDLPWTDRVPAEAAKRDPRR
ncbi:MAG TPA: sigma 54-interacting transcriptional regulator [Terriglobales bacterium]